MGTGRNEFALPSGATLIVSVAPWEDIKGLHDAVWGELRSRPGDLAGIDLGALKDALTKRDLGGCSHLIDRAIGLIVSKPVEAAMFKCAEKAVYQSGDAATQRKVAKAIFDAVDIRDQVREDYYEMAFRIAEVNLRPFGKALSSLFTALGERLAAIRGSSAGLEKPSSPPSSLPPSGTAEGTPNAS